MQHRGLHLRHFRGVMQFPGAYPPFLLPLSGSVVVIATLSQKRECQVLNDRASGLDSAELVLQYRPSDLRSLRQCAVNILGVNQFS